MHRWSWTVIQCCWGAWAVLWLVLAFAAKRTVDRSSGVWGWSTGIAAGAVFLVLRAASGPSWDRRLAQSPQAVQVLAAVLVALGLVFCGWARITLGGNWSGSVVLKQDHELVQRGPYALVRHPIYTGMLTMILGTVLDYPSVFSYVGLAFIVVVFFFKSRREERLMVEHFPDAYPGYRARVKALIPFILYL